MIASLVEEPLSRTPVETPPDEEVFVFPATAAQQRFWLLDQFVPGGNPALNTAIALSLRGYLDLAVLARALNALAERHESLRTTFQYGGGELCQLIAPALSLHAGLVDVRDFPEAERASVPDHLASEEAARPFDLAAGPLCRALLVRLSPVEHTLLLTLHHIICDGWSNGVLLRELATLYEAFSQGKPSPLPPLPLQFADFAQWQQDRAASGGFDADLAYWREKLAGALPVLDLPADRPRPAATPRARVAAAGTRARRLPHALAASLKTLAVREGASAYMFYLAAFTVLLARYDANGGEDILVGTPSANRGRAEIEGIVGLFANPLLLRADLSGDPTFRELLVRVRQTVLDAFEHAEAPFERVIEELQSRRLQVNFLHASAFLQPIRLTELELRPQDPASGGAMYEWDASVIEEAGGVRVGIEYNADRFDAATLDRVLADYEALLAGLAAPGGMNEKIWRLPLAPLPDAAGATPRVAQSPRIPRASAASLEPLLQRPATDDATAPGGLRPGVVGRHGDDAPTGVPGEICVRARGQAADGTRTGGLGVRGADGRVEWLGRLDAQLHADGQRVDLRAVETALAAHPHIREAVVLAVPGSAGVVLTAWFQGDGAPAALVSPEQLRLFLRERLPESWLPAAFVAVEQFPVTAGGLLDEARLPAPAAMSPAGPAAGAGAGEPYLTLHFQLIELWQELLHVPRVGIHDDFFALGGHSLLAMRMLARVEELCGRKLLPATLFRQATVEGLADALLQRGGDGPPPELIAIQEKGARTPIFYLHGDMTGGGYYCMKLSRRLGPDQPFYAIPPADISDWRELPSVEVLADRHLRAIRGVRPHGPYIVGGFCLGGLIAHAIARQLAAEGETVERLLLIDATARNRRLKRLRRGAEWLGRRRGWDASRQLYHFCRWHFMLERFNRWREMGMGGLFSMLRRRVASALGKVFGRFSRASGPVTPPAVDRVENLAPHDRGGSGLDGSWFDPRWDAPLVFLWAEGGYEVETFAGPATLLLSRDLTGPDAEEPAVREWARHLPNLDTRELAGSHLASITEHVDGLAETIREVLAKG